MMKRISILLSILSLCHILIYPQLGSDWQKVRCISSDENIAVFTSEGEASKKDEVGKDAKRRLFYALFYKGVIGFNDTQPLITKDNASYTDPFFNDAQRYESYILDTEGADETQKVNKKHRATCTITVSIKLLKKFLADAGLMESTTPVFGEEGGPVMPTIIVVPYKKTGETYQSILENDFDRRVAVANVQDGFRSRKVTTYDLAAVIRSTQRRSEYENNSNAADSNDKQLLLSSGADVYVEVDMIKDKNNQGTRVSLVMRAYETATGALLASKDGFTKRYPNAGSDLLAKYAVQDHLQPFLDDICSHWDGSGKGTKGSNGTRVVLQFAIDGSSATTFNDPAGPNNYSLSNIIRQWVRKNCYKGQYHLKGIMAESIIFDSVTMPPTDADGLSMDAAQFAFLIESYLKEEIGIDCSSRIDGNIILFTIY